MSCLLKNLRVCQQPLGRFHYTTSNYPFPKSIRLGKTMGRKSLHRNFPRGYSCEIKKLSFIYKGVLTLLLVDLELETGCRLLNPPPISYLSVDVIEHQDNFWKVYLGL